MKRLLIIISIVSFMFADDPVGNWKLSGLRVDYFDIAYYMDINIGKWNKPYVLKEAI